MCLDEHVLKQVVELNHQPHVLYSSPMYSQVSDWERRPLTSKQMLYAAQDAHVLITLYDKLMALSPNSSQVAQDTQYTFKVRECTETYIPFIALGGVAGGVMLCGTMETSSA